MINRVILTGRLTRDPEVKQTNSGSSLCRVNLAVSRQFKNKQTGERESDFFSLILWGKQAENFASFTHKGSLVGIDGELRNNNYTNQNGQEMRSVEVNVSSFALLEPRNQGGQNYQQAPQPNYQQAPRQLQNSPQPPYHGQQGPQDDGKVNSSSQSHDAPQSNPGTNNEVPANAPAPNADDLPF